MDRFRGSLSYSYRPESMWSPGAIVLLVLLAASSHGYVLQQQPMDLGVDGFPNNNLPAIKKDTSLENGVAIREVKHGNGRRARSASNDLLLTLLDDHLSRMSAARSMKLTFLKTLAGNIQSLIEQIEKHDISDLLDSPILDFALNVLLPLLQGNNAGTVHDESDSETIDSFPWSKKSDDETRVNDPSGIPVSAEDKNDNDGAKEIDPIDEQETSTILPTRTTVRKLLKSPYR